MARFVFQDKSIHYEEYGAGEPIVVLNGIMMSCGSWAEFVEPFSANNRLILLDMLDQGKSSKMDGPFSQAIQAEVVLALLDELGIEKVSMLGISYGGEVAQRFIQASLRVPDQCRACRWYGLCRNGCRRDRAELPDGAVGLNCYCEAYQKFFSSRERQLADAVRLICRMRG